MTTFKAQIKVTLRPSVLDPAGEAAKAACSRLGVGGIQKLRIGKYIDITLDAQSETEAKKSIDLMTDRLLVNPVIEDCSVVLEDVDSSKVSN